eukprot:7243733-Karenia_brevis.AAC.1
MIKCKVDRAHQVKYKHQTQLVQQSNVNAPSLTLAYAERVGWDPECVGDMAAGPSIYCESLWVQLLDYDQ